MCSIVDAAHLKTQIIEQGPIRQWPSDHSMTCTAYLAQLGATDVDRLQNVAIRPLTDLLPQKRCHCSHNPSFRPPVLMMDSRHHEPARQASRLCGIHQNMDPRCECMQQPSCILGLGLRCIVLMCQGHKNMQTAAGFVCAVTQVSTGV